MTTIKTKGPFATTFHRDGTVTIWDVYRQQWMRVAAECVSDQAMATLPERERARIERMADKNQ